MAWFRGFRLPVFDLPGARSAGPHSSRSGSAAASALPRLPEQVREQTVPHLHVHTAENLVVLTTAPEALAPLRSALEAGIGLRLVCGENRPAVLFAGTQSPTLDPDEGWLLPLPEQARTFVCTEIPAEPGAWELPGINLGIVLE
ncbi:hypothetical protein [Corynebacterium lowii]|uniref:Uncharacterized protein n=1 Tax=Corynebacterium lowii TaxID=1544413 RepID=A0A0Q0YUC3_9CORY|nr:hypothetical protein [Corynebacterium lowii]KQB85960.1 hypothetical protein Clow_01702 [Corynebacterium lowii]MDP9850610.1 hypothetical protein [Corynebacterium lowii]